MTSVQELEGLIEAAAEADDPTITMNIALTKNSAGNQRLRRVGLTNDALASVRSVVGRFASDLRGRELVEYEFGHQIADHQAAYIPRDEVPEAADLVAAMVAQQQIPPLDLSTGESNSSRLFLIRAGFVADGEAHSVVYVRGRVKSEIARASNKLRLVSTGEGIYDRIDGDSLTLPENFDLAITDKFVVLLDELRFEQDLRYRAEVNRAAAAALDDHIANLRIEGFDALKERCLTIPGMARKAASIGRKMEDPDYEAAMDMGPLLEFLERNPSIAVTVKGSGGKATLVYDDGLSERWQILKILDDDYLTSQLTSTLYEASSKSTP